MATMQVCYEMGIIPDGRGDLCDIEAEPLIEKKCHLGECTEVHP